MLLDHIPIRARLSFGHAIWMALIFIGIGIGVYRVVEDNIMQSLDATLMTSAKNIRDENITAKRSPFKGSRYWESLFDDFFGNQKGQIKAYAQLIDTSGAVHAKTRNIRVRLPVSRHALSRADQGQESYETFILPSGLVLRQLSLPVMKRDRFTGHLIQVASSMTETNQTLKSVKRMLWITLSIGLIISVMFGYQLTRWSLRPVTQVTTAVASLGINNDFDKRLKLPPAQDEMRDLMKTFNEMIDRLEDAFMRLRRFSGDVSHELRTPIAVMRGEAELALRRERSPGEYQESLRTVVKEAENMSAIVEDLLLLARAQGKSITLQSETVHVEGFLTSLVESIKPELDRKEIDLKIVHEGKETLEMSPGYFSLALKNLLLNACKHSAQGGVVEIKVSSTYGDTRFDVIDHGEGIPPESLPYIFDTFFRADTARNRGSGGVGIGLSLAKALVSLHGGSLTVESTLGDGARFRATVPHGDKFDGFAVSKKKKAIEMVPSARPTMTT